MSEKKSPYQHLHRPEQSDQSEKHDYTNRLERTSMSRKEIDEEVEKKFGRRAPEQTSEENAPSFFAWIRSLFSKK
ncbi:MAG: hypothetical protein ABII10_03115 [Candidatus Paceibacterota bacterium]